MVDGRVLGIRQILVFDVHFLYFDLIYCVNFRLLTKTGIVHILSGPLAGVLRGSWTESEALLSPYLNRLLRFVVEVRGLRLTDVLLKSRKVRSDLRG